MPAANPKDREPTEAQVEAVARALVPILSGGQEDMLGRDLPDLQFDELPLDWQERHREYARTAIRAMVTASPPVDDWRCINCKRVVASVIEPKRCGECMGRTFAHVWKAPPVDHGRVEPVYAVALQLIKSDGLQTTFSMSQSWRRGGTKAEALAAAIAFVQAEKPGFAVQECLISEISPALTNKDTAA